MINMKLKQKNSKKGIKMEIPLPEGVESRVDNRSVFIKGKLGSLERAFLNKSVDFHCNGKSIIIESRGNTKREKKILGSIEAHLKNMISGASNGHRYVLKICAGHFPMHVSAAGEEFIVKNFLGEKTPRKIQIEKNVKIRIEGREVIVESVDKELAGRMSSNIEKMTMRHNYDRRIFQDGIFIINKDGKIVK